MNVITRLAISSMLAAGTAAAESNAWLIGGGADLDSAQVQIENNVAWLENLLLERGIEVRTYFALGGHPGKDSAYLDLAAGSEPAFAPLARVFGDPIEAGLSFRRHDLRAVRGSTLKRELMRSLLADFEDHDPRKDVLIVYNGHGGLEADDVSRNHLRLWGGSRLDVRELDVLLDRLPAATTTRFVMTQCYSGAFHSLIYENPRGRGRVEGRRCGFLSESALEQAEGCALGVGEDQYRDYSTYFFAALSGATRLGAPIGAASVDRDGDGRVSFREAHLHTLATAHSADLPRSTSEAYLTSWTPWYLQWDWSTDGRHSTYWALAERIAERYDWSVSRDTLEARRRELTSAEQRNRERQRSAEHRIARLRNGLSAAWLARWPELGHPYATSYHELIDAQWPAIARYMRADPRYGELVAEQRRLDGLERELLDIRRHLTQIDKIYRLRDLARLEAAMAEYGSERERTEYARLVECESGHLD